jgi:hypothetical protein
LFFTVLLLSLFLVVFPFLEKQFLCVLFVLIVLFVAVCSPRLPAQAPLLTALQRPVEGGWRPVIIMVSKEKRKTKTFVLTLLQLACRRVCGWGSVQQKMFVLHFVF